MKAQVVELGRLHRVATKGELRESLRVRLTRLPFQRPGEGTLYV